MISARGGVAESFSIDDSATPPLVNTTIQSRTQDLIRTSINPVLFTFFTKKWHLLSSHIRFVYSYLHKLISADISENYNLFFASMQVHLLIYYSFIHSIYTFSKVFTLALTLLFNRYSLFF